MKTIWFTSASGKTTLCNAFSSELKRKNNTVCILDGDVLRAGLCKDLSFSIEDRNENMRRVEEIAKVLNQQEILVLVALVSPTIKGRTLAKNIISEENFIEIYVSTPLEVCIERDPKQLYAKAKQNPNFGMTGLQAIYEAPINPHLTIDTSKTSTEDAITQLKQLI